MSCLRRKRNYLGMKTRIEELAKQNINLMKQLKELEESVKVQIELIKREKLVPFKCPVCGGGSYQRMLFLEFRPKMQFWRWRSCHLGQIHRNTDTRRRTHSWYPKFGKCKKCSRTMGEKSPQVVDHFFNFFDFFGFWPSRFWRWRFLQLGQKH